MVRSIKKTTILSPLYTRTKFIYLFFAIKFKFIVTIILYIVIAGHFAHDCLSVSGFSWF